VRQFTVGSPQMIELNKFFDKVSSHMVLLTVANNPFLTRPPPQQIIERRYFSSHRTVSEHFFLLYVSLPNLYFPSSLPSSPLSLFLLSPPSLPPSLPPVGHPLTVLRETQTSWKENISQPLITSHIITVAMTTQSNIYVTLKNVTNSNEKCV